MVMMEGGDERGASKLRDARLFEGECLARGR